MTDDHRLTFEEWCDDLTTANGEKLILTPAQRQVARLIYTNRRQVAVLSPRASGLSTLFDTIERKVKADGGAPVRPNPYVKKAGGSGA